MENDSMVAIVTGIIQEENKNNVNIENKYSNNVNITPTRKGRKNKQNQIKNTVNKMDNIETNNKAPSVFIVGTEIEVQISSEIPLDPTPHESISKPIEKVPNSTLTTQLPLPPSVISIEKAPFSEPPAPAPAGVLKKDGKMATWTKSSAEVFVSGGSISSRIIKPTIRNQSFANTTDKKANVMYIDSSGNVASEDFGGGPSKELLDQEAVIILRREKEEEEEVIRAKRNNEIELLELAEIRKEIDKFAEIKKKSKEEEIKKREEIKKKEEEFQKAREEEIMKKETEAKLKEEKEVRRKELQKRRDEEKEKKRIEKERNLAEVKKVEEERKKLEEVKKAAERKLNKERKRLEEDEIEKRRDEEKRKVFESEEILREEKLIEAAAFVEKRKNEAEGLKNLSILLNQDYKLISEELQVSETSSVSSSVVESKVEKHSETKDHPVKLLGNSKDAILVPLEEVFIKTYLNASKNFKEPSSVIEVKVNRASFLENMVQINEMILLTENLISITKEPLDKPFVFVGETSTDVSGPLRRTHTIRINPRDIMNQINELYKFMMKIVQDCMKEGARLTSIQSKMKDKKSQKNLKKWRNQLKTFTLKFGEIDKKYNSIGLVNRKSFILVLEVLKMLKFEVRDIRSKVYFEDNGMESSNQHIQAMYDKEMQQQQQTCQTNVAIMSENSVSSSQTFLVDNNGNVLNSSQLANGVRLRAEERWSQRRGVAVSPVSNNSNKPIYNNESVIGTNPPPPTQVNRHTPHRQLVDESNKGKENNLTDLPKYDAKHTLANRLGSRADQFVDVDHSKMDPKNIIKKENFPPEIFMEIIISLNKKPFDSIAELTASDVFKMKDPPPYMRYTTQEWRHVPFLKITEEWRTLKSSNISPTKATELKKMWDFIKYQCENLIKSAGARNGNNQIEWPQNLKEMMGVVLTSARNPDIYHFENDAVRTSAHNPEFYHFQNDTIPKAASAISKDVAVVASLSDVPLKNVQVVTEAVDPPAFKEIPLSGKDKLTLQKIYQDYKQKTILETNPPEHTTTSSSNTAPVADNSVILEYDGDENYIDEEPKTNVENVDDNVQEIIAQLINSGISESFMDHKTPFKATAQHICNHHHEKKKCPHKMTKLSQPFSKSFKKGKQNHRIQNTENRIHNTENRIQNLQRKLNEIETNGCPHHHPLRHNKGIANEHDLNSKLSLINRSMKELGLDMSTLLAASQTCNSTAAAAAAPFRRNEFDQQNLRSPYDQSLDASSIVAASRAFLETGLSPRSFHRRLRMVEERHRSLVYNPLPQYSQAINVKAINEGGSHFETLANGCQSDEDSSPEILYHNVTIKNLTEALETTKKKENLLEEELLEVIENNRKWFPKIKEILDYKPSSSNSCLQGEGSWIDQEEDYDEITSTFEQSEDDEDVDDEDDDDDNSSCENDENGGIWYEDSDGNIVEEEDVLENGDYMEYHVLEERVEILD